VHKQLVRVQIVLVVVQNSYKCVTVCYTALQMPLKYIQTGVYYNVHGYPDSYPCQCKSSLRPQRTQWLIGLPTLSDCPLRLQLYTYVFTNYEETVSVATQATRIRMR